MTFGEEPIGAKLSLAEDRELEALYAEVMGEMMVRHQEKHRDHWEPVDPSLPRLAVDDAELSRMYQAVHDEMMRRHEERPGVRGPAREP